MNGELLAAALTYAARGWHVLPLHDVVAGSCSCGTDRCRRAGSEGKHPRLRGWQDVASSDPAEVEAWWSTWPTANVGVLAQTSGLVVVDVDPRNGGDMSLAALEAAHGPLPSTLTAETGGGGWHYLFRHPGCELGSKLADGVDLQAGVQLFVAAPSLHRSGSTYRWVDESAAVAELPGWIVDKARRDDRRTTVHDAAPAPGAALTLPAQERFPELIPPGVRSALWTPVTRGRYRYVYRGAIAAARAGWTEGQYVAYLSDSPMVSWVHEHGEQALARHVGNAYRKVAEQGTFLDDVWAHVVAANEAVDLWVGRDGRRRRRVLWNVQSRAWDMGGGEVPAALRDLEAVGPESRSTVHRTLPELCDMGWVRLVPSRPTEVTADGQGVSSRLRLTFPRGRRIEGHDRDRGVSLGYVPARADRDVWTLMRHPATRREALGVKADTLQALALHGPLAVGQLASLTGLAARTVRDHLAVLGPGGSGDSRDRGGYGLVHVEDGRWSVVDGWLGMLDRVAEQTGAGEARLRQQERAEVQRRLHRDYLAEHHTPAGFCSGCGQGLYVAGVDRCRDCGTVADTTDGHAGLVEEPALAGATSF